jgi:hypothetical protein
VSVINSLRSQTLVIYHYELENTAIRVRIVEMAEDLVDVTPVTRTQWVNMYVFAYLLAFPGLQISYICINI